MAANPESGESKTAKCPPSCAAGPGPTYPGCDRAKGPSLMLPGLLVRVGIVGGAPPVVVTAPAKSGGVATRAAGGTGTIGGPPRGTGAGGAAGLSCSAVGGGASRKVPRPDGTTRHPGDPGGSAEFRADAAAAAVS